MSKDRDSVAKEQERLIPCAAWETKKLMSTIERNEVDRLRKRK